VCVNATLVSRHVMAPHVNESCKEMSILGDPGATSRDDAMFSGERHFWRESLL